MDVKVDLNEFDSAISTVNTLKETYSDNVTEFKKYAANLATCWTSGTDRDNVVSNITGTTLTNLTSMGDSFTAISDALGSIKSIYSATDSTSF